MCLLYLYSIIDITGFVIGFMRRTHFCRKNAIFNTLTRSLKEQENGLHLSRADSYGGLYSARYVIQHFSENTQIRRTHYMESPKFGGITNLSQRGQANAFSIAKYVVLLLCLQTSISLAASDFSASPSLAPINPEFTARQSKMATSNFESRDAEGHLLGLVPSPIDRSHLLTQTGELTSQFGSPPSSYDLRNYGWVTSVRDQGNCGSCWAFGTYGA